MNKINGLNALESEIICCLNAEKHLIEDCVRLKCGGKACTKCASPSYHKIKCGHCSNEHRLDKRSEKIPMKDTIDLLIISNYDKVSTSLTARFKEVSVKISQKKPSKFGKTEKNADSVLSELKQHRDRFKLKIDQLYDDLAKKIKSYDNTSDQTKKLDTQLNKISGIIDSFNNQKKSLSNLYQYQAKILEYEKSVDQLSFESVKFIPNECTITSLDETSFGRIETFFKLSQNLTEPLHEQKNSDTQKLYNKITKRTISDASDTFEISSMLKSGAKKGRLKTQNEVTSSIDCLPVCRSRSLSTEDSYKFGETDMYKAIVTRHDLPDIGCGNVSRVCISQDSQTAFISDDMNRRLLLLNMNDSTTKFFDFDGKFKEPWALVYDNNKKLLYTGDDQNCNIFVFNENMMKIDSISIQPDEISITALEVDSERNLLYVSDALGDCIFVLNTSTKTVLEKQTVDLPSSMKIKNQLIFVVSGTEKIKFSKNNKNCKLLSYDLGSNCIFVYDRFEWTLKRTIRHDWLNPRGLHIDDNMNILTVALENIQTGYGQF